MLKTLLAKMAGLLEAIVAHPFNQQLADGSLKSAIFQDYLEQDYLYLAAYVNVLGQIADLYQDPFFAELSNYIKVAEISLQQLLLDRFNIKKLQLKKPIQNYLTHLDKSILHSKAAAIAAILPCFWVYTKLGEEIKIKTTNKETIYLDWLKTYKDEQFTGYTKQLLALLELQLSSDNFELISEIFATSVSLEHAFFISLFDQLSDSPFLFFENQHFKDLTPINELTNKKQP